MEIRRSKSKGNVKLTFVTEDASRPMSLVGDFNDWDPLAHPLKKRSNGTRSTSVTVEPGTELRVRVLADGGEWLDVDAAEPVDGTADRVVVA